MYFEEDLGVDDISHNKFKCPRCGAVVVKPDDWTEDTLCEDCQLADELG
jgi:hypothetical protein